MHRGMVAAALTALAAGLAAPRQDATVRWRTDWDAARKEARLSGKPLFVVFRCER